MLLGHAVKDIEKLIIRNSIFYHIGRKKKIETVLRDWNLAVCSTLDVIQAKQSIIGSGGVPLKVRSNPSSL